MKSTVTVEDLQLTKATSGLSYPVVIDGTLYKEILYSLQLTEEWFYQELHKLNLSDIQSIFFASITEEKQLHVSLKHDPLHVKREVPPMFH